MARGVARGEKGGEGKSGSAILHIPWSVSTVPFRYQSTSARGNPVLSSHETLSRAPAKATWSRVKGGVTITCGETRKGEGQQQ